MNIKTLLKAFDNFEVEGFCSNCESRNREDCYDCFVEAIEDGLDIKELAGEI